MSGGQCHSKSYDFSAFCTGITFFPENKVLFLCVFGVLLFCQTWGERVLYFCLLGVIFWCFLLLMCSGGLRPAGQHMLVDKEKIALQPVLLL